MLVYPKNSIRQIPGVWDELNFPVLGRQLTLNDIESIDIVEVSHPLAEQWRNVASGILSRRCKKVRSDITHSKERPSDSVSSSRIIRTEGPFRGLPDTTVSKVEVLWL